MFTPEMEITCPAALLKNPGLSMGIDYHTVFCYYSQINGKLTLAIKGCKALPIRYFSPPRWKKDPFMSTIAGMANAGRFQSGN